MQGMSRKRNLSNPKPGHNTGGTVRSARRSGRARSRKIGCQQNYSPRKQKSTVPSKASKKRRFNVSPEARTSEILCKPTGEQNQWLTSGLPAVYQRDEKRALFLAAEQWNDALLSLYAFSCKACPGIEYLRLFLGVVDQLCFPPGAGSEPRENSASRTFGQCLF